MSFLFTDGKFHGFTDSGSPLAGGLLYTDTGGMLGTPKTTYSDSGLTTPNTYPVVLDDRGEASVWLGAGPYLMTLKTSAGVMIWSQDGIVDSSASPVRINADDYSSITAALAAASAAGGGGVWLTPGKTYSVSSTIVVPDMCGLVSDGTAILSASYTDFNNADPTVPARYGSNAVVVDLSGETIAPYAPKTGTFCVGVHIKFTRAPDGRRNCVQGIVARNVVDVRIEDCEVSGFPVGCDIRVATLLRGVISGNHVHDRYDNNNWTNDTFTVSGVAVTPTAGATYTNNGQTFTVASTLIAGGIGYIFATSTGAASASGTLTKTGGTGDATIAFSAYSAYSGNPAYAQMTGIEVDNDVLNSDPSSYTQIIDNTIDTMVAGTFSIAANRGYQTDGINVANKDSNNINISANVINQVAEGIDLFGKYCNISGNNISEVYNYGIKLIHGASYNDISGGTISNFGLGGIVFAGSDTAPDTIGNCASGVTIAVGDYLSSWSANSSYCIGFVDNGGATGKPRDTTVTGCTLVMGNAKYGWLDTSTGSGNNWGDAIFIKTGASTVKQVLVSGTTNSGCRVINSSRVRLYRGSAQTITSGGGAQKVQWDSVSYDTRSEANTTTTYRWTCQVDGFYNIRAAVQFSDMVDTEGVVIRIYQNGLGSTSGYWIAGATNALTASVSDTLKLAANDYIEIYVLPNTFGANRTISGGSSVANFTVTAV